MSKKIIILTLLVFLLSSCFWWDSTDAPEESTWLTLNETQDFGFFVPASWEVLKDNSSLVPTPQNWRIALAVTSKEAKNNIYNNLVVLKEEIKQKISSSDYSILNNSGSKWEYLNYKELEKKDIKFDGWANSKLYIFKARYNEKTPTLNFLQTWVICWNDKWFFLTIALNPEIKSFKKYENILKTFKCK